MNNRILIENFGNGVTDKAYNNRKRWTDIIVAGETNNKIDKELVKLLQNLDEEDRNLIVEYLHYISMKQQMYLMRVFDENEQYKILYNTGESLVNVAEVEGSQVSLEKLVPSWIEKYPRKQR